MAAVNETSVHRFIRALADQQRNNLASDQDLLRRFVAHRDQEAFATLFRCHGAMVLGVAARVLHHHADAEDVRQATFLLLATKAGAITWRTSVANWLFGAAYRLALQSRRSAERRKVRDTKVKAKQPPDALADITLRDLQAVLDEELNRLPKKLSAVLILCCVEGKARDEVAQYLALPLATVKSRLEAARELLRSRLTRRGLTLSIVLASVTVPSAGVHAALPVSLVLVTSQAAVQLLSGQLAPGLVSADVLTLLNQRAPIMSIMKLNIVMALLVTGALALLAFALPGPVPPESAARAEPTKFALPKDGQQEDGPRPKDNPHRLLEPELGEQVMALKHCSTGEWLATAEMDGTVRLWNTKTQRAGPVLQGPQRMVRSVVFTPDSTTVVAGCDDGKIYVWEVPAGKLRTTLEGHQGSVFTVALASDGKTLASCAGILGQRGSPELKIWDLSKAKCVRDIECKDDISGGAANGMVFAPKTDLLAVACLGPFRGIKVWNTTTGKEDRQFAYDEDFPLALAISPDGTRLVGGGGSLKIWNWKSGKLEHTLMAKTEGCNYFRAVAFSPDGTRLVAGCPGPSVTRNNCNCVSNVVYCWDAKQWTRLWATPGLYGDLWALDLSPDGQSVTCSDSSGTSVLDTCLGLSQGYWLTTKYKVDAEDFGASRVRGRPDWPDGLVKTIDVDSRVYALWVNGTETFFYRGKAKAVNEAMQCYAAVKSAARHLVLLPGSGHVQTSSGKPIVFDWQIQAPGGFEKPDFGRKQSLMTVYISALKPRPVDREKVEKWFMDLDSAQFGTREAANEELRKLGNDAKPALRATLQAKLTLETRRRVELLLERLPSFDLTDLEIPKGVTVMDAGDLIAKGLKDLKDPDRGIRINAMRELSALTRLGDKVVPALLEIFEKDQDMHIRQVAAACLGDAGIAGKSAVPALKLGLSASDVTIRHICQSSLSRLAQAEDTPAQNEHMRREQAIAEEIQGWKKAQAPSH
jgi:RNA polymerase sigma factor (sigma-70 family)